MHVPQCGSGTDQIRSGMLLVHQDDSLLGPLLSFIPSFHMYVCPSAWSLIAGMCKNYRQTEVDR